MYDPVQTGVCASVGVSVIGTVAQTVASIESRYFMRERMCFSQRE